MQGLGQTWKAFRQWRHGPKGFLLTLGLLLLAVGAYHFGGMPTVRADAIDYAASADETVVTVNGNARTLRDLAYYVGHLEMEGQRRAKMMDSGNPRSYWNTYVGQGLMIKLRTRNEAMDRAVHDEIFYQMALKEKISLTAEDDEQVEGKVQDFWEDIQDYKGPQSLGITRRDIEQTLKRVALAQKYQYIYARMKGAEYEDYGYDKEGYQELLAQNSYEVNKKLWERVDIGNVLVG